MAEKVFDRETVLDLTVNVIPLVLLAFFFLVFVVVNPFGGGFVIMAIQLSIVGLMFVGLAAITYYSGAAVSKAEIAAESAATAEAHTDDTGETAETPDENGDVTG